MAAAGCRRPVDEVLWSEVVLVASLFLVLLEIIVLQLVSSAQNKSFVLKRPRCKQPPARREAAPEPAGKRCIAVYRCIAVSQCIAVSRFEALTQCDAKYTSCIGVYATACIGSIH